jgi:hypothetical protein
MVFKTLRELTSKELINIGGVVFLIGFICVSLFKKAGLVIIILSYFVSLLGVIFLILGNIKLKREKEQLGKAIIEERIGTKEQGREKNKIKIIIASIIIPITALGVIWYFQWHKEQEITEEITKLCNEKCCEYNTTDKLWEYTCDISQCCAIILGEKSSPECCMGFPTQKLCINYCSTELKKMMEPKIPWWLRLLRNFY